MASLDTDPTKPDTKETALEAGAALATMGGLLGPVGGVLGGVVSQVLLGSSTQRHLRRLSQTLGLLRDELATLQQLQDEYVHTEDFEDLAEKALNQASSERHEAKRRVYARFIAGLASSAPAPYDERRQQLRTLEELQLRHVEVLRVLASVEDPALRHKDDDPAELLAIDHGHSEWIRDNSDVMDQLVSMGLVRWAVRRTRPRLHERRGRSGETRQEIDGGQTWNAPLITEYGRRLFTFLAEADLPREQAGSED